MTKKLLYLPGEQAFDPATVLYLIGDGNYAHVHLVSGQAVLSCRTLKWYADQWPTFLRVHKGMLINPAFVRQLRHVRKPGRFSLVVMHDLAQLPIARRRVSAVIRAINQVNSRV